MAGDRQWIRAFQCTIGGIEINPELRVQFRCQMHTTQSPDLCTFSIINLKPQTATQIAHMVNKTLELAAGYKEGTVGKIYKGEVHTVHANVRISPTDRQTTVWAITNGSEVNPYLTARANTTLKPGSTDYDVFKYLMSTWPSLKVGNIPTDALKKIKLPRGISLFGDTKDHMRKLAFDVKSTFHIDMDSKVHITPTDYKGNMTWEVNSTTGMLGMAQQTNLGVIVRVLLNPNIKLNDNIHLNQPVIEAVPQFQKFGQEEAVRTVKEPNTETNGVYRVIAINQVGDSRGDGNDWYTELYTQGHDIYKDAADLGWT